MSNNWYASKSSGGTHGCVADEVTGRTVAIVYEDKDTSLLAAAPEMLAALEGIVKHIESIKDDWIHDGSPNNTKMHGLAVALNNRAGDLIEDAIKKAKGE